MEIWRKYGVATTVLFPLIDRGTQDFEATPVTFAAGDCQIMRDEAAFANTTNLPADRGGGFYSLALTAAEMQAARIGIRIVDQTATKLWEDQGLVIVTYGNASAQHEFDLDAATVTVGTNNDKTGYSISGTKTTLDSLNDVSAADVAAAVLPESGQALSNLEFLFVSSGDGRTPVTGATGISVSRSIDGGAFAAATGTVAEVGNGIYQFDASVADMTGGIITFRFSATGGTPAAPDDTFLKIVTNTGV